MLSIKNIVSEEAVKKSYNKDLFLSESELIEISDLNEDKNYTTQLIKIGRDNIIDNNTGDVIGLKESTIRFLDNDKNSTGIYLYNMSQRVGYNGDRIVTIYRQQLSIRGLNWLLNKNDVEITGDLEKELVRIYDLELQLNKIDVKFYDALEVALIQPNGTRKLILEDSKYKAKILFDKNGLLYEVTKALIETKATIKFKSLDEDSEIEIDSSKPHQDEKKNNSFFESLD